MGIGMNSVWMCGMGNQADTHTEFSGLLQEAAESIHPVVFVLVAAEVLYNSAEVTQKHLQEPLHRHLHPVPALPLCTCSKQEETIHISSKPMASGVPSP